MTVSVALDAMGGDYGIDTVIPAAIASLQEDEELSLILVGVQEQILAKLNKLDSNHYLKSGRLRIANATQTVGMDESPTLALRSKKDSSMRVGINLVKQAETQAFVSAGNTGALMATARFVLKTLPGIDRPAIIYALPTLTGHTHMLDLGANVGATPEHLFQFAVMGAEVVKAVDNIDHPKVGLLNIGEEEIKGNEVVKDAARLLANSMLNYQGFVEGDDIYQGVVDVVVCDGFVGNVALKTSEGVATMIRHFIKQEFTRNWLRRLIGWVALPALKAFRARIDWRHYNGASFIGLQGIVIKSHGGADVLAFRNAIQVAKIEVKKAVPNNISQQLQNILVVGE